MAPTEVHPFTPFLPQGARMLMLGTFPPAEKRWSMRFYFPNFANDMWRIFGLCFYDDKLLVVRTAQKTYDLEAIKAFLQEQGIAIYDSCTRIVRTRNTASDKDLQVVEETPLGDMLRRLPQCQAIITAGQLATTIACRQLGIGEPRVGDKTTFGFEGRTLSLWRMPSSSRAYPLPVEKKAEAYRKAFDSLR